MATSEVVPVEAPDPFQGKEVSLEEYSKFRKEGTLPERFQPDEKKDEPPAAQAETVPDKESGEAEQEKQDRDEKGKFREKEPLFTADQQKAFDRAFAKREAKLRRDFEDQLAAKTSSTTQVTPPVKEATAAEPKDSGEPMPPDIPDLSSWEGTAEEYQKAIKAYPVKLKAFLDAQRHHEERNATLQRRLVESEEATKKAHPEYREEFDKLVADIKNGDEVQMPNPMISMISEEAENPHELTHYLATHRDEYQKFAAITNPVQGLKAIVRLEAQLQAKSTPAPEKKASPTKAPPPPAAVGARATATAFDVMDEKLSPEEWMEQRNADLAKRGKR